MSNITRRTLYWRVRDLANLTKRNLTLISRATQHGYEYTVRDEDENSIVISLAAGREVFMFVQGALYVARQVDAAREAAEKAAQEKKRVAEASRIGVVIPVKMSF